MRSLRRESARALACPQDVRQDVFNLPRARFDLGEHGEGGEHIRVIRPCFLIDGEHPRGVAYAEHLLSRKLPVHIACECCEEIERLYMFLPVQKSLIEMCDAPALRNVELQLIREDGCRRACHIVPPCAEFCELLALPIKGEISVHHCADANRADLFDRHMITALHIGGKMRVACLDSCPNRRERVRPDPVFQVVFPRIAAGGYCLKVRVDEHRFDPRRAELDSENGSAAFDSSDILFEIHIENLLTQDVIIELPATQSPRVCVPAFPARTS